MDEAKARTRQQILEAAAGILESEGVHAVSTRSVAAAAGIRAASLYQFFEDKDGLLAALAVHAFDLYLTEKQALDRTTDPVADMRLGWDLHVEFGLTHPALYLLMFGTSVPGRRPPATDQARLLLMGYLDRVAAAGRLRVPPPLAADLVVAAVTGVVTTLIGTPARDRDPDLSPRTRELLVDALVTDAGLASEPGLAPLALALDAAVAEAEDVPLRPVETALLRDWLGRLAR